MEVANCDLHPAAKMGLRRRPYAFTEHGIAMLSSVLNSERAIQVNIAIIRAFVRQREILASHKDLAHRLDELEKKVGQQDEKIHAVFEAIRQLMAQKAPHRLRTRARRRRVTSIGRRRTSQTIVGKCNCIVCPWGAELQAGVANEVFPTAVRHEFFVWSATSGASSQLSIILFPNSSRSRSVRRNPRPWAMLASTSRISTSASMNTTLRIGVPAMKPASFSRSSGRKP